MSKAAALTRRKFVALFAAVALAMSMSVIAPASAFAVDATSGTLVVPQSALGVTTGTTALTNTANEGDSSYPVYATETDGDFHLDFKIDANATNTAGASVNKHSGILTTTSTGVATVIVNLCAGDAPTGNSGNPCSGFTVLDTESFTISATASSTYTYQGTDQSIMMTSPAVVTYSGSNAAGWTNNLGAISATSGDYYHFCYSMSSGIGPNSIGTYEAMNADAVTLYDSDGIEVATLGDAELSLAKVNDSKVNLDLVVDAGTLGLATGSYSLVFDSTYTAGNSNNPPLKALGTDIAFTFSIVVA